MFLGLFAQIGICCYDVALGASCIIKNTEDPKKEG